jgi:hypothetical protein
MPTNGSHAVFRRLGLAGILVVAVVAAAAAEDYLGRDDFLAIAFGARKPEMQTLWLTRETRAAAEAAVGWAPTVLRLRYWQAGERTAWILEDVGKEQPITLGVAVAGNRIERVDVLAFRESRGWEIRYPFFTEQFSGLSLADDGYLSAPIDGITGATLSVRAVERVARLALWLDAQVRG